jgi:hypothetical protein
MPWLPFWRDISGDTDSAACDGCDDSTICDGDADMSYESDCDAYAFYGDPEREHYDYEANAAYDRYDGLRADFNDEFGWEDEADDEPCVECGYRADCPACIAAKEDYDSLVREQFEYAQRCADSAGDNDDVPF